MEKIKNENALGFNVQTMRKKLATLYEKISSPGNVVAPEVEKEVRAEIDIVGKQMIAGILGEQNFNTIKNEKLRVVANDLYLHCTLINFIDFDFYDLADFAADNLPSYFDVFEGNLKTIIEQISTKNLVELNDTKCKVLLLINSTMEHELTVDELDQIFNQIRKTFGNDNVDITWSYMFNDNLLKKNLRLDVLVIED